MKSCALLFLLLSCSIIITITNGLRVALTFDIPPYIQNEGTDGLEPAILKAIFPENQSSTFDFLPMSYNDVETAITPRNVSDVALAMTLPHELLSSVSISSGDTSDNDDTSPPFFINNVYYSQPFIAFTNAAFVKTSDGFADNITSIAQLNDYGPVFTWEGALTELGTEFEQTFSNPNNDNTTSSQYTPVANQTEQVLRFWNTPDAIIIIDSSIFAYASIELLGYNETEYVAVDLFPPVTTFAVGFASLTLRNDFERGMDHICDSGEYAALLQQYQMKYDAAIVCDNRTDIVGDKNGNRHDGGNDVIPIPTSTTTNAIRGKGGRGRVLIMSIAVLLWTWIW